MLDYGDVLCALATAVEPPESVYLSRGEMQRDSADSTVLHFRVTWCLIGTKDGSVSSSSGVHFTLPNPLLHEERGRIVPSLKVTQRVTSELAAVSSAAFPAEEGAP